jgi:hypothetical protein
LIPPHQLEGLATLKKFASTVSLQSQSNNENSERDTLSMSAPFKLSALNSSTIPQKSTDDINIRTMGKSSSKMLSGETAELRKIWQGVLRECHRADPERTGQVNRTVFIGALERANLPNVSFI